MFSTKLCHITSLYTHLTKILAFAMAVVMLNCAHLEKPRWFFRTEYSAAQPVVATVTKPGMGTNGGPMIWDFWVKSRTAASDAMLGSFTPFYKLNATRIAMYCQFCALSRFVFGDFNPWPGGDGAGDNGDCLYESEKCLWRGRHPYTNDGARIVILGINIQDDYSTTGNYIVSSPRDLYSNDFTQKLSQTPVAVQQYSSYIGQLGGYSNEMSIINYDLNPVTVPTHHRSMIL